MTAISGMEWMNQEVSTGTTIMATEFDQGVIIGADSRTTTGAFIANRVTDKLTKVTDYVYCCRSGSAADTQAIADIVKYHIEFHRMEMGEEPLVKTVAHMFKQLCYDYRDQLMAGIIVAGWDKVNGGQVYSIPISGMIQRMPFSTGGSGSTYVYGYVDANFKEGMNKDDSLKFISNSVALAMARDGSSGGIIRLAAITKDGVERFTLVGDQIPKFFEG